MAQKYVYKIFYASRDKAGQMWCSDCRRVESTVSRIFSESSGLPSEIIYVGDKPSWKDLKNQYRQAPWNVSSVPTVLKYDEAAKVVGKVEEDEILDEAVMEKFLKD